MVRTQIQLTERQSRKLKTIADQQGVSVAELIRRAVDHALDVELPADRNIIRARALEVVGKYADSADDVSEQHDGYLAEGIRK